MKKKLIICLLCIAAIVAAVIYFLPMIQEQLAYNKVKSEESIAACDSYEKDWPEGKLIEDVLYKRVEIAKDDGTCVNEICKYLRQFPDGKYVKEVNDRWDEIWDKEIKKYEDNDKSEASASGIDTMRELLLYMKQQRTNTLFANFESIIDLKEFDEYEEDIQLLMERTNETSLPYKEGIIPIKSSYDSISLQTLNNLLVEKMQQHLDHAFSPGFIQVVAASKETSPEKLPTVNFGYVIENMELYMNGKEYPEIRSFPLAEDDEIDNNPEGFFVGVLADITISFSFPEAKYIFEKRERTSDYLKQVKNMKEGYQEMTSLFFSNSIGLMAKDLGL